MAFQNTRIQFLSEDLARAGLLSTCTIAGPRPSEMRGVPLKPKHPKAHHSSVLRNRAGRQSQIKHVSCGHDSPMEPAPTPHLREGIAKDDD